MPGQRRSKEQTWKESELKSELKTINDEKKSRESRSSRSHGDQDYRAKPSGSSKDRDRHSENYKSRSKKEGEKVDRQEERAAEHEAIRQHREGDVKDKERHRGNRDKRDRERDKEKERNDREHGERKHRDRDGHRDGDKENRDRDRERRREPKDMDKHREPDRERHRNDKDGERHKDDREKHRDDRERHKDDRRKHRDDREKHKDEREKHRDDRERYKEDKEKHRDDRERTGDRDKDRDRYRDEKDRKRSEREKRDRGDRDDRDHRKHRDDDKDRERVHREKNGEGNERRNRDKEAFGDSERRRGDREAVKDSEGRHKDSNERDRHHRYERESKGQNKDEEHRKLDREHRNKEGLRERRHKSSDRDHRDKDGSREQRHRSGDRGKGIRDERERGSKNVGGKEQYKESDQSHLNLADESIDSRSKSSSKRRQPSAKDVTPSDPEESHAAEEDEDYDDDFEEYDEDFEDFEDDDTDVKNMNRKKPDNSRKSNSNEVDELFSAMNRENDRLLATSRHSESSDVTASSEDRVHIKRPATSRQRGFINFVAAKQRDMSHKTASKARKRCTELMKMIELDTVVLSLFDMPPVKEYDLYMSSFGRTNAQQVYIQTKDDNLDRDAQTEEIEFEDKWTQHPVEGRHACGGGSAVTERDDSTPNSGVEDGRLSSFLVRSCQVIEKLLAEEQSRSNFAQSSDSFSSSEAFTTLRQIEILRSRKVIACQFSPSDSNVVLTMHSPPTENVEKTIDKYGIIAIWNVNDPSKPQKLAVSACYPSCCCFSPMRPTLVFAGMLDGSVVAWDLREPKTMHHSHICGDKDWLLRLPTYNTAGVLQYSNHASPVRAIAPIISNTNKTSIQDSGLGISFQLASVEQDGVVNLWVVAEALETTQAGSESDLGLAPNGKLKLLKSSSIALQNPILNDLKMPFNALNMHISVINQNHFYIPTDSGSVIHGTRFGNQKTIPRGYSAHDFTPCRITSIDLHPKGHPVMVCGSENGTLQLYHLQSENPILSWDDFTNGAGIQKVLWSRNCSYVIFVLDTNSVIHMWDLLRNDLEPLASDSIPNKHVVDLTLSDETIAALKPKMALSFDDGGVEVHMLSSHVSTLQPGEDGQFVRYIEQL